MLDSNTTIVYTPVIEVAWGWYVVMCGSKNGHYIDEEIETRAQNLLTILGSLVNMIGGTSTTT